jgi:hypothetical protein
MPPPGGQPPPPWPGAAPAPPGGKNRKPLLIGGAVVAGLAVVGFLVWLFAVALAGDDDGQTKTSARPPSDSVAPTPEVEGRSPEVAFAPIPGFTFVEAPPEMAEAFDEMLNTEAPGMDFGEMFAGIDARGVEEDGDEVAVAMVFSMNSDFADTGDAEDFAAGLSSGVAGSWGADATTETITVGGQDAVVFEGDGEEGVFAYRDGLAIMVLNVGGDRATMIRIMEGMLENASEAA